MHVKSVWQDTSNVNDLHQEKRTKIESALNKLNQAADTQSPLGFPITGEAGSGKTHLLGAIRKYALSQGMNFVLVDMTDVRDFWETVLQGYVSSLQEADSKGMPQIQKLIACLVSFTERSVTPKKMASLTHEALKNGVNAILNALAKKEKPKTIQFQDVIRAVILLNSEDFALSGIGYNWLQGLEIEPTDKQLFGFKASVASQLSDIVEGLSWIMSLRGASVLALDQFDAIVTQHHYVASAATGAELSAEQQTSKFIIEGIGGGLMALRDKTYRTQIITSCLEATWQILRQQVISTFQARFQMPLVLGRVLKTETARSIIQARLQKAYEQIGFMPPYPTWPYTDAFFQAAVRQSPRRILQRCDQHRQQCLAVGEVTELNTFDPADPIQPPINGFETIDRAFAAAQRQVNIQAALDESQEDGVLGKWLETVGDCLVLENPTADEIDAFTETRFPGGRNYPQMHSRVRLVFREEGDREKHLCLRALQRSNHAAYRARLKAAMTISGIDHALSFRRLMIVRTHDLPGGAKTQELTQTCLQAGGLFAYPTEAELRTIGALHQLKRQNLPNFNTWLRDRRPVSQLPFMQNTVAWLFQETKRFSETVTPQTDIASANGTSAHVVPAQASTNGRVPVVNQPASCTQPLPPVSQPISTTSQGLPIGSPLNGQQTTSLSIPLEVLTKHTVILASSGAGKTVLVRRLVEEAALQGIPAIVVDCANDLARLGDRWPQPPTALTAQDREKAERYYHRTEVVVWTPGREAGNPMTLNPLPDFAALIDNSDELNQAIDMARDSLQDTVISGTAQTIKVKRGILRNALHCFAKAGGGSLDSFAEFLADLPEEATGNISKAAQKAQDMADALYAEISNNPLLRQQGAALDPALLLGANPSSDKVRLSVINFVGLPGQTQQQQFLNQLAMTLFTWIKKNPAPPEQPLRGLMVIDEAKDFVPSKGTTPCKSSLNRLAAQARKYGLGLIFATQAPKSIDHNIIANCSTQFYGRANSPAAIDVIRDQIRQRGGTGDDVPQLERGQFYAAAESLTPPVKMATPLCLSYHPSSPLDEASVLKRAKHSRSLQ